MCNATTTQCDILTSCEIGAEEADANEATPTGDECIKCYNPLFCVHGQVQCLDGSCSRCGVPVDSDAGYRHPSDVGPYIPFGSQWSGAKVGDLTAIL